LGWAATGLDAGSSWLAAGRGRVQTLRAAARGSKAAALGLAGILQEREANRTAAASTLRWMAVEAVRPARAVRPGPGACA
jgi:hypothetical protein